jgi:hypothetical protein
MAPSSAAIIGISQGIFSDASQSASLNFQVCYIIRISEWASLSSCQSKSWDSDSQKSCMVFPAETHHAGGDHSPVITTPLNTGDHLDAVSHRSCQQFIASRHKLSNARSFAAGGWDQKGFDSRAATETELLGKDEGAFASVQLPADRRPVLLPKLLS